MKQRSFPGRPGLLFFGACAGVLAAGNPCRVLREIGEHDREYYYKRLSTSG